MDFTFDGNEIRGLEQNPQTKPPWAQLARSGKKVMQFLSEGRYLGSFSDSSPRQTGLAEQVLGLASRQRFKRYAITDKSAIQEALSQA